MKNLQETIKRVLREETDGFKKRIKNTIEEFGIYQTAKMLGISQSKLVEITEYPIDSVLANELLIENIKNNDLPTRYNEFRIYDYGSDIIGWICNIKTDRFLPDTIEQITVMATPFWDGENHTPVEIDWFTLLDDKLNNIIEIEGEGNYFQALNHQSSFKNVEELFNWYKEFYLPEVYDIVMNKLLPKVHKNVEYELKFKFK